MKNPNWTRDEIILALDLYFDLNGEKEEPENDKVIELSAVLNNLSTLENRLPKFRNVNGVSLKLQNLRYYDPARNGGMSGRSELDNKILDEFYNDRILLKQIAIQIKEFLTGADLSA